MPNYTLIYFDARGRAEYARLILAQAKVPYTDERITYQDLLKIKDDKKRCPSGQLPVLVIDDSIYIYQSLAIARYLATENDLTGENPLENAQIDAIAFTCHDILDYNFNNILKVKDERLREENRRAFLENDLPARLKRIINIFVNNNGGNDWIVGTKVTWADLIISNLGDIFSADVFKDTPALETLISKVKNLPNIKEYLQKRPKTDV